MRVDQPTNQGHESMFRAGARKLLGNRFGLLAIAATILGLGAYSSWGWLVAVGLAPILLSVAPCAAMCALGLCTMGKKPKSEAGQTPTASGVKNKDCCS